MLEILLLNLLEKLLLKSIFSLFEEKQVNLTFILQRSNLLLLFTTKELIGNG